MLKNLLEGVTVMVVEMNMFGFGWHSFLDSFGALHRNSIRRSTVSRRVSSILPRVCKNHCLSR
jgi:hypothetical protein